jgi:hypothetical protein
MKIKYMNLAIFTLLLNSFLATENLQNHFFSKALSGLDFLDSCCVI